MSGPEECHTSFPPMSASLTTSFSLTSARAVGSSACTKDHPAGGEGQQVKTPALLGYLEIPQGDVLGPSLFVGYTGSQFKNIIFVVYGVVCCGGGGYGGCGCGGGGAGGG